LAAYLLPKKPVDKRWRFHRGRMRVPPSVGQLAQGSIAPLISSCGISNGIQTGISQRLRKGSESFRQESIRSVCGLQCPCPALYNNEQISEDLIGLQRLLANEKPGSRCGQKRMPKRPPQRRDLIANGAGAGTGGTAIIGRTWKVRICVSGRAVFFKDEMVAPPLSRRAAQ